LHIDRIGIPGDFNGDGIVGIADLLAVLGDWGKRSVENDILADLNGDGIVNIDDLLLVLSNWGNHTDDYEGPDEQPLEEALAALFAIDQDSGLHEEGQFVDAIRLVVRSKVASPNSDVLDGSVGTEEIHGLPPDVHLALASSLAHSGFPLQFPGVAAIFQQWLNSYDAHQVLFANAAFGNDGHIDVVDWGGLLQVDGDFLQTDQGELVVELTGSVPIDDHDLVVVDGYADIDGILNVSIPAGIEILEGDTFIVVVAEDIVGEFSEITSQSLPDGLIIDVEYCQLDEGDRELVVQTIYLDKKPMTGNTLDLSAGIQEAKSLEFITDDDNNDSLITYTMTLRGDVNDDSIVDVRDVVLLLNFWGSADHFCDLNGDGFVDSEDLSIVLYGVESSTN